MDVLVLGGVVLAGRVSTGGEVVASLADTAQCSGEGGEGVSAGVGGGGCGA